MPVTKRTLYAVTTLAEALAKYLLLTAHKRKAAQFQIPRQPALAQLGKLPIDLVRRISWSAK